MLGERDNDTAELEAAAAIYVDPMLKTAPLGLRITKETLNTALKVGDLHAVIDLEERAQSICGRGPDFEEAMKAFLEKREPRYAAPPLLQRMVAARTPPCRAQA